ncbi:hypothetical protein NBRC10512_001084 [Rhodotorula toruloides]|uniref:RHTO0S06e11056g1_1 n=2 Tax=Rhodotorula toruloides TaxID=5286 RepID=A0A061AXD0_RHOTO|nr:uncharacterized protein RHTO_04395 [Rhodotorula toruloides NP11]EMS19394.1 hypothetical protein RHTO_04395 [Rhodotorula toruloides NP11]CDR42214.1 RHTO0S06e11056g1_1 [Rhodotorula toruloides]
MTKRRKSALETLLEKVEEDIADASPPRKTPSPPARRATPTGSGSPVPSRSTSNLSTGGSAAQVKPSAPSTSLQQTPRTAAAKELESLSLASPTPAPPRTPKKRRHPPATANAVPRRASPPSPASPVTPPFPSSSPYAPTSCPTHLDSPSPTKRSRHRLRDLVSLFLLCIRSVAATEPSPLASLAARLDRLVPGLDLPHLVHLARTIQENQRLLSISHVHSQAGGRTFDASLNFLGNSLFQDSPFETSDAPQVALHLARALQLYPPPILAVSADPPLPILCTPRTSCRHCSSALTLRKRPTEPFWLVDSASPAERVLVAHLTCTNRHCRAVHHPDHVEYDDTDGPMWMWEAEPDAIKVGQRVWVTKGFARHFRMLLLEQAVSPGGFAALWNKLYAESRSEPEPSTPDEPLDPSFFDTDSEDSPDDEEKSTSRPRSSFFRLTSHHVWRSFVLYSCILVSSASSHTFTSSPRPSIADLVALGNSTLFGSGIANVHDLSPHHCSTCSKPRRRWLGGPATEAEREKGVLWAGTSHRTEVEEDAIKLPGPPVQLAVCDGTEIGHLLCAAPDCPNSPELHRRSGRFCSTHAHLHEVCGIVDCGRTRSDDGDEDPSEACDEPEHQELWLRFLHGREQVKARGWRGRHRASKVKKETTDDLAALKLEASEEESDASDTVRHDSTRVSTMWACRRSKTLQTLVAACGAPLAWATFADGETPASVIDFLSTVHASWSPDAASATSRSTFPSYIAYDRSCDVLRSLLRKPSSSGDSPLPPFLRSSRLIVTAFHKQSHPQGDAFCDEFCDPTPLDGRAPDLVVPYKPVGGSSKRGPQLRTFERAFNTSAAEQLNSTLSRFAPLLSTLKADNFTFLVHVLLRYRRDEAEKREPSV